MDNRYLRAGLILAGLLLAAGASAAADKVDYLDELPPLIDRELFFGDPEITASQVSPDGRFMSFQRPYKGVMNVWVKPVDAPFDEAKPMTTGDRPVPGHFWSMDSEYLLYVQDKGGNENFHVYAVDPEAAAEGATGVPPARDLTPLDGVRAQIYALPEDTPGEIIVGLNDRDPALHDVYRLDIASGERELLIRNTFNVAGWVVDHDGRVRLAVRQTADGGTETLKVVDGEPGEVLYSCNWRETCGPMRFHADNARVYFQSNKGDDVDLTALYLMDAETGETELVERDPEGEVDFGGALFANADERLLATVYVGDRTRIYPRAPEMEKALEFLRAELPDGEISFSPQTHDDRWVKVTVSRDVDPGTVYLFDWQEYKVEKLYETRPELPSEHLAPMEAIRYAARDGLEIQGYLTTPKGVGKKDLALVALIHGGPWARDTWGYSSIAQFLANRGYAVLQPNFRGSTGFGKKFLNAGNKEWGQAMQHDITDGVKHLAEQGIVDENRVCIMGGSYGGYATLAGMTFTPELYNCGVDIVGPSNLVTLLNSIPPYWGPIRKIFTQRMGSAETEQGRALLEKQSPLFSVDSIAAPLLVIQGANDPRVKKAESDQIVVAMREKDLPVEYIVAPDEGHGFRGRENRMAMFARIEEFLAEHNGGRYQKEMSGPVAERLEEITVDVASVEAPEEATELDAARTLPLPAVDAGRLQTGKTEYTATLEMNGREMELTSARELALTDDGRVRLVATSEGPMGGATDTWVLAAQSMIPVTRRVEQGPATIEVDYGDEKVTGTISAGQQIPIELKLGAPAFGDSAALETAVLAMPLEAGYSTTVRAVEVGAQQRVRFYSVAVADAETVEVPAGEFETWKVALEPIDGEGGGQTLWVTKAPPRVVVKSETRLPPQMGGAIVASELTGLE
ncbi:MAG: S9 family peptidase [Wenzhouxiangellaceae bacterium]|nr:S9 family peptidase [Wenzhouxiangellaceae bacterium]